MWLCAIYTETIYSFRVLKRTPCRVTRSAKLFILGLIVRCKLTGNCQVIQHWCCVDVLIVSVMYMMSNKAGGIEREREREGEGNIMRIKYCTKAKRKRHRVRIGNSPTLQTSGRLMVFWPRSISPPTCSRCIMSACRDGKHIHTSAEIYIYEHYYTYMR
jgi:hypothetical protein